MFCSNAYKSKTWALTGIAISQAALVMPAKAGIQRQPCARAGIGQRQRRPVSVAPVSVATGHPPSRV
ncbi:hypothetical protein [Allofranklinella schreckenbergeri]|uniref:hypothetical protein n=1 Tax=Allofranklinella schreckenbergeri TaxID=1076744 RepID=UPI0011C4615B|nr:hypothetical protein [Allofranklinella schreckenbergeri]